MLYNINSRGTSNGSHILSLYLQESALKATLNFDRISGQKTLLVSRLGMNK